MSRGRAATRRRQNSKPHSANRECINMIVVELCDGICWICDRDVDLTLKSPHRMAPSMDHLVDRQDGGAYTVENLRLAHRICNELRYRC